MAGKKKVEATRMGFEPTRAEHNGLAVHRLNHSATSSSEHAIAFLVVLFSILSMYLDKNPFDNHTILDIYFI